MEIYHLSIIIYLPTPTPFEVKGMHNQTFGANQLKRARKECSIRCAIYDI